MDVLPQRLEPRLLTDQHACEKTHLSFYECFPYVCPESVLLKWIIFSRKWRRKKTRFLTDKLLIWRQQPRASSSTSSAVLLLLLRRLLRLDLLLEVVLRGLHRLLQLLRVGDRALERTFLLHKKEEKCSVQSGSAIHEMFCPEPVLANDRCCFLARNSRTIQQKKHDTVVLCRSHLLLVDAPALCFVLLGGHERFQ
jgi:hypothetical protein